ncbi:uncharacterized protein EDB91DRAFT_675125 [Suillus paluster]|uniref:uncharacterized protein n=1 Tax=Suillus paluster TaxID=48578 RepID=UPI001B85DC87|nr:uncharacterized protein EDB91DRAFT_675125 [Suillus paluster]KAG1732450.1 hypothetical protein EDB91DRAFT_675125 [Suillus paluster]
MLKRHWLLYIYSMLLTTGFNFMTHGSQDLYPTYLETTKGFSSRCDYRDHYWQLWCYCRRCYCWIGESVHWTPLDDHVCAFHNICSPFHQNFVLLVGAFIPLWVLPSSFSGLSAGAFCIQVVVQGVIPIQLAEMSSPGFRATFPGVAYQLSNVCRRGIVRYLY